MSQTLTYERAGDGQKLTNQTVGADGTRTTQGYEANYDGKDYPRTGSGYADTIALRRIDLYTVEETLKKAGKVFTTVRQVVSKDRKMMTFTVIGTNARASPYTTCSSTTSRRRQLHDPKYSKTPVSSSRKIRDEKPT